MASLSKENLSTTLTDISTINSISKLLTLIGTKFASWQRLYSKLRLYSHTKANVIEILADINYLVDQTTNDLAYIVGIGSIVVCSINQCIGYDSVSYQQKWTYALKTGTA